MVVIENRPGAGGNIAADMAGQVGRRTKLRCCCYNSSSIAISPALFRQARSFFNPGEIFTPVAYVATQGTAGRDRQCVAAGQDAAGVRLICSAQNPDN